MIDRLEVSSGPGTVIRYGSLACWASSSASASLISFLAESARNLASSPVSGDQLADHLEGVLRRRDPEPHVPFAVIGPSEEGWTALLHGPVQVWDGTGWTAPTADPGWLRTALSPRPALSVSVSGASPPSVSPDSMWDLEAGVVPGGGFILIPSVPSPHGLGSAVPFAAPVASPVEETAVLAVPDAGPPTAVLPASGVAGGAAGPGQPTEAGPEEPAAEEPTEAGPEEPAAEEPTEAGPEEPAAEQPSESQEPAASEDEGWAQGQEPTGVEEAPGPAERAEEETPATEEQPGPAADGGGPSGEAAVADESGPAIPAAPSPPGVVNLRSESVRSRVVPYPPLPPAGDPPRPVPGAPVVAGVPCPNGHVNRPGMPACARCGRPVGDGAAYQVSGTRPALGCLITDRGAVYRLDSGYLVGRDPSKDPTVRGRLARPLVLAGDDVADSHAEIRLHDWDVVVTDRSSEGGTHVFEPGATAWERLRPYDPRVLQPGTHVAFGQRVVTFVTPWTLQAPAGSAGQETSERY